MNEQVGKKRDWIKNAAIVFLTAMLILTFFSNTIMNYSLPEVSAQYVTSGTIQAKVRGSGTITAGDPYSVKAESSKTIASVAVRNGDHVEKDQVLIYLEEGDSSELKAAEKALDQMLEAYKLKALDADIDPETTNKILSGKFTDFDTYYVKINNMKKEIAELEDHIELYKTEMEKSVAFKQELEAASSAASKEKREAYEKVVADRKALEAALKAALEAAAAVDASVTDAASARTALENIHAAAESAQKEVDAIKNGIEYQQAEAVRVGYENAIAEAKEALVKAVTEEEKQKATADWNQAVAALETHKNSAVYVTLAEKEQAVVSAKTNQPLFLAVVDKNAELEETKMLEEAAWKAYEAAGPDTSGGVAQYTEIIAINQAYIEEQQAVLNEKQKALTELLTQMTQENALSAELEAIAEQRALVEKLKGGGDASVITAPVSGTVQGLYLTAGDTTSQGNAVATILPDGKGFTMEVAVTKDQAQKLNPGDIADIQNSWYYSNVTAVLQQIKTDRNDPANKRILVFSVEGDVNDGQSLNISIGQKSANYDCIVPNSAVREDNNGKFILIVSQKSSPLGNRYFAERVDIQVLGSDDTQSAVSGALYGYEFVITTSTKPVEAGQLIRLKD